STSLFLRPASFANRRDAFAIFSNSSMLGVAMGLSMTLVPSVKTIILAPSLRPISLRISSGMTTCPLVERLVIALLYMLGLLVRLSYQYTPFLPPPQARIHLPLTVCFE